MISDSIEIAIQKDKYNLSLDLLFKVTEGKCWQWIEI